MSLQEEVEEKRMNLKNLFLHRSGSAPRRPEGTIACIPNAMIMVKSDLFDLKNWMDSSIAKVDCIEAQLDEAKRAGEETMQKAMESVAAQIAALEEKAQKSQDAAVSAVIEKLI